MQLTDTFKAKAEAFFASAAGSTMETAKANTERLMRFLTDYDWWHGGKSINRSNDWFISPVSTLLNMPQNDSNFIARVVGKTTEVASFREAFKQAIAHEWTVETPAGNPVTNSNMIAENILLYGVPGCGKSHTIKTEYCDDDAHMERAVFHPDYTYSDFVGQILPKVVRGNEEEKDSVEYIFNPGPFTLALIQAISSPDEKIALVIEEINRGNAPAIFGDIFQLLDRDLNSISEYGIVNVSLMDYLNNLEFLVNGQKKKYIFTEIKIPGNMDIFATMNTSDQNVYTLDTAFIRRWEKEKIKNSFEQCTFASTAVPGMPNYTWKEFVDGINEWIAKHLEDLQVNEDKQIGVFFVKKSLLTSGDAEKFAFKVFDYLWSDVAKLDHGVFFNPYDTLEDLIADYRAKGVGVFKPGIFEIKPVALPQSEANNE
jgi:hypothetical protein